MFLINKARLPLSVTVANKHTWLQLMCWEATSLRSLSYTAVFRSGPKHGFLSCKDPYKHFNLSFPNEFLSIKCWQLQAKFLWLPSPTQKHLASPYSESTGWWKQKATALIESRLLLSCPSPRLQSLVSFQKPGVLWDLPECRLHSNIQSMLTRDKTCAFQISQPLRIVLHVLHILFFISLWLSYLVHLLGHFELSSTKWDKRLMVLLVPRASLSGDRAFCWS